MPPFKDGAYDQKSPKIQFWSYENLMPRNEEISVRRIQKKIVKKSKSTGSCSNSNFCVIFGDSRISRISREHLLRTAPTSPLV